jgi:hypothetical protein
MPSLHASTRKLLASLPKGDPLRKELGTIVRTASVWTEGSVDSGGGLLYFAVEIGGFKQVGGDAAGRNGVPPEKFLGLVKNAEKKVEGVRSQSMKAFEQVFARHGARVQQALGPVYVEHNQHGIQVVAELEIEDVGGDTRSGAYLYGEDEYFPEDEDPDGEKGTALSEDLKRTLTPIWRSL